MRNTTVKVKNIGLAVFGLLVLCLWLLAIPLKARDISEADLIRTMQELIEEASKFSQDLAQYLDTMGEDWEFWFRKGNHTNPVTHMIYFSQPDLRKYLELINKETDPGKKAKLKEAFKWDYIEIILHEAGHRKYLVETKANENPFEEDKRPPELQRAEEEIRNTTGLINRLIAILYQLNKIICGETPSTPSDGAKGLVYPFKGNLEFMLQAGLAFGSLSGFKGTVTDQAGKNLDVILGKEEQATGYWLPLYLAGAMTDQQQAARVSPGGLGISLGLRYSFGNKPAPAYR